jgi:Ca2+-binding EF-hand superfamily protein
MSNNNISELREIFEYELKTKLTEKAKSSISEYKTLLNCFKYYDINNEGYADESMWINAILKTGITGFSQNDLQQIYKTYVSNNNNSINYQEFCKYIFGKENLDKISYVQMRNKVVKNDLNKLNTNFQNIDLNKYNRNYYNKQKEYENVSGKYQENNYENLINKFKEKININNGMNYYSFVKSLKENQEALSQSVSIDELSISIQQLHLGISSNDIYEFFNYLDTDKIGRISTNDILNIIKEPINEKRQLILNQAFKSLDTEKKGEISITKLKNSFNAKDHPDILDKNKTEDEIYNQFCYTLDIFIRLNNITTYIINQRQFIDYYSGISPSIKNDDDFERIIKKVWNMEKKPEKKKNYYNIIYKNVYEEYPDDSEMGMNSIFFGESHSRRPKYDYNYDYLEEFYKSSSDIPNKYNINNDKINKYKNKAKVYLRNNTQDNLKQSTINVPQRNINLNINKINEMNTLNNKNIQKRYFLYESDAPKDNGGIKIFKKRRYNPITDEYIKETNSFDNGNGNNVIKKMINDVTESININPQQNEEIIKEEINEEQNANNTLNEQIPLNNIHINNYSTKGNNALLAFKKILISRGIKGIFRFQKMLSIYDRKSTGLISFDNFYTIFQSNYINIPLSDIKSIFSLFDKNKNNNLEINDSSQYYIKYDDLLKSLIGNMSNKRKILIQKVFNSFNKNQNGKILITDIKNRFNPGGHPDVVGGVKTENKILSEFLDALETFREYNHNLHGGYDFNMSFQEFNEFHNEISMTIEDDNYFENMINNCYNMNEIYEQEEKEKNNINKNQENDINNKGVNIMGYNYKKINSNRSMTMNNKNNNSELYSKNIRMKVGSQIISNKYY